MAALGYIDAREVGVGCRTCACTMRSLNRINRINRINKMNRMNRIKCRKYLVKQF